MSAARFRLRRFRRFTTQELWGNASRAAAGLVPEAVIGRRKTGFGGPVRAWFRGQAAATLQDRVEALSDRGLVATPAARHIVQSARHGRWDASLAAWALVCLHAWSEAHG